MKNPMQKVNLFLIVTFLSMLLTSMLMPFYDIMAKPIEPFLLYFGIFVPSFLVILFIFFLFNITSLKLKSHNFIYVEPRQKTSTRLVGMDIVRTIAVFFVPIIHFFGLTGYYSTPLDTDKIFYFSLLRWLSVCAVPLFLIITGYFKLNKTISLSHYKAIIPVLLSHIVISSIRLYVDFNYHHIELTRKYILDRLLYFEYGWYVKLYIGMLILMPFFNLAYKGLETKENKLFFILSLVGLTSIGRIFMDIVPQSWLILYVFMYYLIGCFLREYRIKINKSLAFVFLCIILFLTVTASFNQARLSTFDWDYLGYLSNSGYSSLPVVITSFLICILFMDIDFNFKPLAALFKSFSVVSLEIYLFSQMFDGIIYKPFQESGFDFYFYADRILYFVPLVIGLSYISSNIKRLVFFIISLPYRLIKKITSKNTDIKKQNIIETRQVNKTIGELSATSEPTKNKLK